MLTLRSADEVDDRELQALYEKLQTSLTLASLVLAAWQLGLWFARKLVEQQLQERAQVQQVWSDCGACGSRLESKGFVPRRMLTLVGWVEWRRRVGRCPNRCAGSHSTPFDAVLGVTAYQQTSIELMRLGCLLAVFLPLEIAVHLLMQLCGIRIRDDSVWQWVQHFGRQACAQLGAEVEQLAQGIEPKVESLDPEWPDLPLVIAADGVSIVRR